MTRKSILNNVQKLKVADYLEDNCPGNIRPNLLNLFPDIFHPETVKAAKSFLDCWLSVPPICPHKQY
eukprot:3261252-Ditylum_brightwellii.AAC.1